MVPAFTGSSAGTGGSLGGPGAAFLRAQRSREAGGALPWVSTVSAAPSPGQQPGWPRAPLGDLRCP